MLKAKTVFIVGAGASSEVGLPVGDRLKDDIHKLLSFRFDKISRNLIAGNESIFNEIVRKGNINVLLEASRKICNGIHYGPSIDDFVDTHQSDTDMVSIAKVSIVTAILAAERRSGLYFDAGDSHATIEAQNTKKSWFHPFFYLIRQGVQPKGIADAIKNITIICFNYDRCLEHFMTHAMASYCVSNGARE